VQVWIGTPERPVFEPPPPEAVPERLEDLLVWWRTAYADLSVSDQETIIRALARLHHDFVSIHPFEDGNGRMARLLIDLAAEELLGRRIGPALHADASRYFEALRSADQGDLKPLASIVADALAPPA
jgi:fido (protein-threonine AMPylation protein)